MNMDCYVIQRKNGDFLAVDTASGGYEYWVKNIRYDAVRGVHYAKAVEKKEEVVCRPIILGTPLTVSELVAKITPSIRERALSKLTQEEREALGF